MFFEIQGKVMMEFGYTPDDNGFAAFGESLQKNEGSDEEYDELAVRFPPTIKFIVASFIPSLPPLTNCRER